MVTYFVIIRAFYLMSIIVILDVLLQYARLSVNEA